MPPTRASLTSLRIPHRRTLLVEEEKPSSTMRARHVPLSKTGAELLFETISQRYERASTLITSDLPFDEWTEIFGSERLTGALLDRISHHVHILEMNADSYRLKQSAANEPDPRRRAPTGSRTRPNAPPSAASRRLKRVSRHVAVNDL